MASDFSLKQEDGDSAAAGELRQDKLRADTGGSISGEEYQQSTNDWEEILDDTALCLAVSSVRTFCIRFLYLLLCPHRPIFFQGPFFNRIILNLVLWSPHTI